MKKEYEVPEITIIEYTDADIITSSSLINIPVETEAPGWVPGWF